MFRLWPRDTGEYGVLPNCGTKQPEMAQPVYQQPAQGGAVPMGAQPVIQNSQGYHNHPVSPAYNQPQANPVNPTNAQPAQPVQTAAPMPEPIIPQTAVPTPQPETAPQPAPMPQPAPVIAEARYKSLQTAVLYSALSAATRATGVKFCSECGMKL